MPAGRDVDAVGWNTGLSISGAATGITIANPTQVAIALPASSHAAVNWGPLLPGGDPANQYIGYTSVNGSAALLAHGTTTGSSSAADVGAFTIGIQSTYPSNWASYHGQLGLQSIASNNISTRLRFYDTASVAPDPDSATYYADLTYAHPGSLPGDFHGLLIGGSDNAGATLVKFDLGSQQTTLTGALAVGAPVGGMPAAGAINAQAVQINGAGLSVVLAGSTDRIGGSPLPAGSCASGGASIAHATTAMVVVATPQTYPGDGFIWTGSVATEGLVTVKLCAIAAGTPTASTYNIRVLQ
jgi:hypothetical protein